MPKSKKTKSLSAQKIARAWRDPSFRAGLSAEERAAMPPNPAGESIVDESRLNEVAGGFTFGSGCMTAGCFTACWTNGCNTQTGCMSLSMTCTTQGAGTPCLSPVTTC